MVGALTAPQSVSVGHIARFMVTQTPNSTRFLWKEVQSIQSILVRLELFRQNLLDWDECWVAIPSRTHAGSATEEVVMGKSGSMPVGKEPSSASSVIIRAIRSLRSGGKAGSIFSLMSIEPATSGPVSQMAVICARRPRKPDSMYASLLLVSPR